MSAWLDEWPLLGLFFSAFISSTLLPGGSEALLRLHHLVAHDIAHRPDCEATGLFLQVLRVLPAGRPWFPG